MLLDDLARDELRIKDDCKVFFIRGIVNALQSSFIVVVQQERSI